MLSSARKIGCGIAAAGPATSESWQAAVHGRQKQRGLDALVRNMPDSRLVKLMIPNKVGKEILKNLSTCGIVETSVFPDLEGLSRELETQWGQMRPNDQKKSSQKTKK